MSSKIVDFNLLLAKADKNTNNAHKLLEEKKLQSQKVQQKANQIKSELSKKAALEFIQKKKEEIRLRTEKEARELLEQKQKKLQTGEVKPVANQAPSIKAKTNGAGVTKQPDAIVKPDNLLKKATAPLPTARTNKPAPQPKNGKASTSKSQPVNGKLPTAPQQQQQQVSKTAPPKPVNKTPSILTKPPAFSYNQILKLADEVQKDKKCKSLSASLDSFKIPDINKTIKSHQQQQQQTPILKTSISSNVSSLKLTSRPASSTKSEMNEKKAIVKPSLVDAQQQKAKQNLNGGSKSAEPPLRRDLLLAGQNSKENARLAQSKGLSSWDRITSDVKKKQIKNKSEPKMYKEEVYKDAYGDEDEYDSEMDDFIDDEDVDENDNINKKDFSKTIREIFNYNPKRYSHLDEDIDDMETDFHSQMKEEKRSLKMGILEDLEELRKEQETEKKRMDKKKKRNDNENEKNFANKKLKIS